MATANSLARLPRELLDRFVVMEFPRPEPEHFDLVLDGVRVEEAHRLGLEPIHLPMLDTEDRERLYGEFIGSDRSIRTLQRMYAALLGERAVIDERRMQTFPH